MWKKMMDGDYADVFVPSMEETTDKAMDINWDFSSYAGGVKDQRQNYLSPYPNRLVLITSPQKGIYAANNPTRGALKDHLHPIYRNI